MLELARSGANKPKQKTGLGRALVNYIRTNGIFKAQIHKLRPDWFENTADTKKAEPVQLARSGGNRPNQKKHLGQALTSYTCTSHDCYDHEFDAKVRKLRPDWFENKADAKKAELLMLAKKGGDRPHPTATRAIVTLE